MANPFNSPLLVLLATLPLFWLSALVGMWLRLKREERDPTADEDFRFVLGGTLTLLALIVGFTFSMAVGRYDQRKNYEEQEANAIGTEYVRADLLPAADAVKVRSLLREYLDQRIAFYGERDPESLGRTYARTSRIQSELWSAVVAPSAANPTPVAALVLSGMNDVLNSQGYTQAAWWNRIPLGAWVLLLIVSMFSNVLVGYGSHRRGRPALFVLPVALAVTLFFIADIEAPRGGFIRVRPQNLEALVASVRPS